MAENSNIGVRILQLSSLIVETRVRRFIAAILVFRPKEISAKKYKLPSVKCLVENPKLAVEIIQLSCLAAEIRLLSVYGGHTVSCCQPSDNFPLQMPASIVFFCYIALQHFISSRAWHMQCFNVDNMVFRFVRHI